MNKSSTSIAVRAFVAGPQAQLAGLDELRRRLGAHELEIIDVLERPEVAAEHQVLAVPCFVRVNAPEQRRVLGNARNIGKLLELLGLEDEPC